MRSTHTVRLLLALAVLTLPAVAGAEDMWRWKDASGRLHYSNVRGHVPGDAARVSGSIGVLQGSVPGPDQKAIEADLDRYRQRRQEKAHAAGAQQASVCVPYSCPGLAVPYILTLNGNDLADQVKEAAVLDALHIRWRSGLCN